MIKIFNMSASFSNCSLNMRSSLLSVLIFIALCAIFPHSSLAESNEDAFAIWLAQFKVEALRDGISQKTLETAFADIKGPLPEIVERDHNQPEFTQSLNDYFAARVSENRIKNGRKMLHRYRTWLNRTERKYGVQRRFIVALWGIESNYGEHTGTYPVIQSLMTLAYDGRRSSYFRKELIDALQLIDNGAVSYSKMQGSWAGAMGQCQFMPSSFRLYAVDADNSGSTNIWSSVPDVLGSTANYLAKAGWRNDQTWGRLVSLPENFDHSLVGLETRLPLSAWQSLGVRRSNGHALPKSDMEASLIMPEGAAGPAYLVYDNYRVLLSWNRSHLFALAVGTLSDQFKGY